MIIYILLIYIILIIFFLPKTERFVTVSQMKRPFLNLYGIKKDNTEILTNIIFITHPFTRDSCIEIYNEAKKNGCHFLGLTSYLEFPSIVSNPYDILYDPKNNAWNYNYCDLVDGWLYCFQNKDYLNCGKPSILLSESDFTNYEVLKPDPNVNKEFDFILICLKDNETCEPGWQSFNRNWLMAEKFLDLLCNKYKLKGLLIGRINCKLPEGCTGLMEQTDFLNYSEFIKQYNRCKFAIFFNTTDASPRCASESLVFNLPILMNEKILGGWKYIKSGVSGELFNENNFEEKLNKILNNFNEYTPRQHYINNFGKIVSGIKLKEFIASIYKKEDLNFNMDDIHYLKPAV